MKFRTYFYSVAVLLCGLMSSSVSNADDTEIFNQPPGSSVAPNIIFVLDNTANWSRASQQWPGSPTAGDAEIKAIKDFVAGLTKPANVGLVAYTEAGSRVGGYVRFGVRNMTVSANNLAFQNILNGINTNNPAENVNANSGSIANTFFEIYRYLQGGNSWAGMDARADYSGNTGQTAAGKGLTSGFAYRSSSATARYNSPLGTNCAKTYIIFIGNNGPSASPAAPTSEAFAAYPPSYTATPDPQTAWARFLRLRPDLPKGSVEAANGSVITYTIDAYNAQQNPTYTSLLKDMARAGGGKYFQAGSDASLQSALQNILSQIQAVNSVFGSASLPVSVSVRGTFLNQVYLGVFRPDAAAQPNWTGNLKQFKLGVDTSVTPPNLFLADSNGLSVENPTTGFINPNAVSFWTQPSTFWDPAYYVNSQGVGNSSDSPDGDLVEKGGSAGRLRTSFATSQAARNLYTCTGTCTDGSALSSTRFGTTNPSITAAALSPNALILPAEQADIINWVRGGNVNLDDPLNSSSPSTNVRGFVHGDVLHSKPAVINYARTADDIVVFYGSNDGILHAVKGGQNLANGAGNELWGFIAPEHFSQLKRMRDHSPLISTTNPKPYFMDGSPTTYTSSAFTDGKIDATRGDKAYLFMTMRRGGRFMYAFDVSDPLVPKLLWKRSNTSPGFAELGQTWSDMRVAKLRSQTAPVLIFGLGYDASANDPTVQATATMGRGVMIVDATTGNPIWQAGPSATGATTNVTMASMTYAIPAPVSLYDSNRDGFIDRIYAVDTGANVWRINVHDATPSNWTVTKLASLGGTGANARKFLFQADIVPADALNNFDSLLIGSGDREHPFDTAISNRYYMIKDDPALNAPQATPIVEGTAGSTTGVAGQLYDTTSDLVQVGTPAQVAAAKAALSTASGWYVTLAAGEKVVSGSTTLAGTVFFGTNLPAPAVANACVGNLGEARLYSLNYLNGAATIDENNTGTLNILDRYVTRAGGGYPPSPVPISVVINGKTYQGAISGTQVLNAPTSPIGRRYKTFWQRLIDKN